MYCMYSVRYVRPSILLNNMHPYPPNDLLHRHGVMSGAQWASVSLTRMQAYNMAVMRVSGHNLGVSWGKVVGEEGHDTAMIGVPHVGRAA